MSFLFLTVLAIAIGLGASPVAAKEYQTGTAPSWVAPVALKATAPSATGAVADGIDYLLSDVQVRVSGETQARYRRIVRRAVNTGGVERGSNISISFDPSYQGLTLHGVTVQRGGKTLNALARSTIRVLQRETELESQTYDGSKTLNIIVPDVRIGDVVEYHYTSVGANPVFAGSFQDFVELPMVLEQDRCPTVCLTVSG